MRSGRCASLGFRVSGGFATVRVWEDGAAIEGRFWVGSDDPMVEAETGQLLFADSQSRTIPLAEVGPVAWSEGARMAELDRRRAHPGRGGGTVSADAATPAGPDPEVLLRAGALLPTERTRPRRAHQARVYEHPALGDRRVVRLVAEPIGEAEDLALQTLDFRLVDGTSPVALGRPRGLGFPATAILADPANASFALGVVKEMERFARMAKGKPGNAKDGFDAIATRLAASVPHFLPSFHEQAGRAFLDAGALAQAAASFGRAREAERAYGLKVDEAQRRQAFLEFALAGALTAKSLSEYARDLVRDAPPGEAHAALKELCVQRTLGGLPRGPRWPRSSGGRPGPPGWTRPPKRRTYSRPPGCPGHARAAAGFWAGYRAGLLRSREGGPVVPRQAAGAPPDPARGPAGVHRVVDRAAGGVRRRRGPHRPVLRARGCEGQRRRGDMARADGQTGARTLVLEGARAAAGTAPRPHRTDRTCGHRGGPAGRRDGRLADRHRPRRRRPCGGRASWRRRLRPPRRTATRR